MYREYFSSAEPSFADCGRIRLGIRVFKIYLAQGMDSMLMLFHSILKKEIKPASVVIICENILATVYSPARR